MVITGAFLCDAASVYDDKLHVWGGVVTSWTVSAEDRSIQSTLVVLTQVDSGTTDPVIKLEIMPPTGDEPIVLDFPVPEATVSAESGFAFYRFGMQMPIDGRYVFVVSSGGSAVSLPLLIKV